MKLTKQQYLLGCLAEECAEVTQRITKILRFGLHNIQEGQDLTNEKRLVYELNDLLAVIALLEDVGEVELSELSDFTAMNKKQEKVKKYMEFSQKQGILVD